MPDFLTDQDIQDILQEPKRVPVGFQRRIVPRAKRGHSESELDIAGDQGSEFRVIARQSNVNPLDFSVILGYKVPESTLVLRLRRYNGRSHQHTNPIERQTFYDYHIHLATERYQRTGNREDTYAEPTDRYTTLDEALSCLVEDCSIVLPEEPQLGLFAT